MSKLPKRIASPFATSGAGSSFEANVQTAFVVLMMTGGFAPCLPPLPISKIKFQGRYEGYETDDFIAYAGAAGDNDSARLLAQIKHSVQIGTNKLFDSVIASAWSDFNNRKLFNQETDSIALITGPLPKTDVDHTRVVLDWARTSAEESEFLQKVQQANFSHQTKIRKLDVFRTSLDKANGARPISDRELFQFLSCFHLLSYDLDLRSGVMLSLLHSLLGKSGNPEAHALWNEIYQETVHHNQHAGTITLERLPRRLINKLRPAQYEAVPPAIAEAIPPTRTENWLALDLTGDIAVAALVGSWDESLEADRRAIADLARKDYSSWIPSLRKLLDLPPPPIEIADGVWKVTDRAALWDLAGPQVFDDVLEKFKAVSLGVLREVDPRFDLPPKNRFAARLYGKAPNHSAELREGLAEGLALLGARPGAFTHCSLHRPRFTALVVVRELLQSTDWRLWASLDRLMPLLAEAAPEEFLEALDRALESDPCPIDKLFEVERGPLEGGTLLSGLLWALEALAWSEELLVRVSVLLGELAERDPGGQWSNRPAHSLSTIFLPWLPQTTADATKRRTAIETLQKETPEAAWRLLIALLPDVTTTSSGTYKPRWRTYIPTDWKDRVSPAEYWKQVDSYARLALSMAGRSSGRLQELVDHAENLPEACLGDFLSELESGFVLDLGEPERLSVWEKLTSLAHRHRRFIEKKWALPPEMITRIETISEALAPRSPDKLYNRLFNTNDVELYWDNDDPELQRELLAERRRTAVDKVLSSGGIDALLRFAQEVKSPELLGQAAGEMGDRAIDNALLPSLLLSKDETHRRFLRFYVLFRQSTKGWPWADELDRANWETSQVAAFLAYLPFTEEAFSRAREWLGSDEKLYWSQARVGPYYGSGDPSLVTNKLLEASRPLAAIDYLSGALYRGRKLDSGLTSRALLEAAHSKEAAVAVTGHDFCQLISALQSDPETDSGLLSQIEWSYLPLLNGRGGVGPKHLELQLASDSDFFCEVIRFIYRPRGQASQEAEVPKERQELAMNAYRLLQNWKTPPGTLMSGDFDGAAFDGWLGNTLAQCKESGHLEVASTHIGQVLIYAPPDPNGLWIHRTVAEALNRRDNKRLRAGMHLGFANSRGFHSVDPSGEPERELAAQYRAKAEDVENAGFQRLAAELRALSDSYEREAERVVLEHDEE